jgi:hypothetical protein
MRCLSLINRYKIVLSPPQLIFGDCPTGLIHTVIIIHPFPMALR